MQGMAVATAAMIALSIERVDEVASGGPDVNFKYLKN